MKKRIKYTDEPMEAHVIPDFLPPPDKLRLRRSAVRVTYDVEADVLRILLSDKPIVESDQDKPGVVLDYDKDGHIVGLDVLHASKRALNPKALEFAVA